MSNQYKVIAYDEDGDIESVLTFGTHSEAMAMSFEMSKWHAFVEVKAAD